MLKSNRVSSIFLLGMLLAPLAGIARDAGPAEPKQPIAKVAGQKLYEDELTPLIHAPMRQLRNQEYELKRKALDNLIGQKLLEAAAKAEKVSVEQLLKQEVEAKVKEPTEGELESFYLGVMDKVNQPFAQVKDQLRESLKNARQQQARADYVKRLKVKDKVTVLLAPPNVEVNHDPARVLGNPDAPVTIIEFSDYQCPFCAKVEPTLKEILKKYKGKVRLSFRDFPLTELHPPAKDAAEASRCAGEQGKFWEYHDLLYANRAKLDAASLAGYAGQLQLDSKKFESCFKSGKYRAAVEQDMQEGTKLGLSGTPAFFVNGIFLNGAQPAAAFEQLIESELARLESRGPE